MRPTVNFKLGREYFSAWALTSILKAAGVFPQRTAAEYSQLIHDGKMHPFKWDGPSARGGQYVIALFSGFGFPASIKYHSFAHDVEHWLGDESGTTRAASNLRFLNGMKNDGYKRGAAVAYAFVHRFSDSKTADYRWGFGWPA